MENLVKLIWAVNLFFFALIMLFIWSKVLVINGKLKVINELLSEIDEVNGVSPDAGETTES